MNIATKQRLIIDFREDLGRVSYVVKKDGRVNEQFWLTSFINWLRNLQALFDADWQKKLFYVAKNKTVINNGASADALLALKMFCNRGDVINCSWVSCSKFK